MRPLPGQIPLFVVAGYDRGDDFGRRKLLELEVDGRTLPARLAEEARRSGAFSDVHVVGPDDVAAKLGPCALPLRTSEPFWRKPEIIGRFAMETYGAKAPIAVVLADIVPRADELRGLLALAGDARDSDLVLFLPRASCLHREKNLLRISPTGGTSPDLFGSSCSFYLLRPGRVRLDLISWICRVGRPFRQVGVAQGRWNFGLGLVIAKVLLLVARFPCLWPELPRLALLLWRFQHSTLTLPGLEKVLARVLVKARFRGQERPCRVVVHDLRAFTHDIDSPVDAAELDRAEGTDRWATRSPADTNGVPSSRQSVFGRSRRATQRTAKPLS